MQCKCSEIINYMEQYAPSRLSQSWDNTGLLIGDPQQQINKVLVALDATPEVIGEAIEKGVELIITHHPLIFKPISNIKKDNPLGDYIISLIKNNISLYSAHTNLDMAVGGVNDTLATVLQLEDIHVLQSQLSEKLNIFNIENSKEEYGFAKIGKLNESKNLASFAEVVKKLLGITRVKIVGDVNKIINSVVVTSGAYSSIAKVAKDRGADAIVTGDLKYHDAREIEDYGLCAIDAGHFATENIIVQVIIDYITNIITEQNINIKIFKSQKSKDVFKIF